MAQKIVVAKLGFDAGTETNPNNLNYSSDYNTLKYFSSGSITIQLPVGTPTSVEGTVSHNLGYYPFFSGYVSDIGFTPTRYYPLGFRGVGGLAYLYLSAYIGSNSLFFRAERDALGTAEDWTFNYFIFRNDLGL